MHIISIKALLKSTRHPSLRVVDCDKDPSVPYDRTFMACACSS